MIHISTTRTNTVLQQEKKKDCWNRSPAETILQKYRIQTDILKIKSLSG